MRIEYKYLVDKMTRQNLKGAFCMAIRKMDGKCIRGKNSNWRKNNEGIFDEIVKKLVQEPNFN